MKEKEEENFVMKEWHSEKIKIRNKQMKMKRIANYDQNLNLEFILLSLKQSSNN